MHEPSEMTAKARAAFEVYRDLGPSRTLMEVARLMGYSPTRRPTHLQGWCAKFEWVRLCAEHDHADLRDALGKREVVRERVTQTLIDGMSAAAGVLLEIAVDRRQIPMLDRHGQPMKDADGNALTKDAVRPSTRAEAAKAILGLGGIVAVRRSEVTNKTPEHLDEAAAVLATFSPDELSDFMEILERSNARLDAEAAGEAEGE